MEYEFIKQRLPGRIAPGDEIIIFNSDEPCENGKWHIADVDGISGEVMLVGLGSNGGSIMQINMLEGE